MFLALMDGPEPVSGLIANCGAEVVGVSNVFSNAGQGRGVAACLAAAGALWPGLAMVSYRTEDERGQTRLWSATHDIGALRVWQYVGDHSA